MSNLAFQPSVKAMTFVDPRVDIDVKPKWIIRQGPPNVSYENIQAPSTSMTAQTIQLQVPDLKTVVDRELKMYHDINIKFQGVATGPSSVINLGTMDSLRRLPIQQMLSGQNIKLNQENITSVPNQYIQQLGRYQKNELCDSELSTAPMYHDTFSEYPLFLIYGDVRNPMGSFGDNERPLRGAFPPYLTDYNNSTGASLNFQFEEPIQLSPLTFNWPHYDKGFVGLNNITLQMSFQNNAQTIWSHAQATGTLATTSVLTSVVPSYNVAPTLYANFMDANNLFAAPIERSAYYYSLITPDAVPTNYGVVQPGATFTAQSSVIQLTSLPKAVMVYAKQRLQDMTYLTTDTTAAIQSISFAFMNKQNIFANASQRELYRISRQNGFVGSWLDWAYFSGAVLLLVFSKDIPIPSTQATSLQGKYQLQVQTATMKSLFTTQVTNFDLWIVSMYEGILELRGGQASANSAVLNQLNVLDATKLDRTDVDELGVGGNIFDSIKSFFVKTLPGVARQVGPAILKGARVALPIAEEIANFNPELREALPAIRGARRLLGAGFHVCPTGGCATCSKGVGKIKKSDLRSQMAGGSLEDEEYDVEQGEEQFF